MKLKIGLGIILAGLLVVGDNLLRAAVELPFGQQGVRAAEEPVGPPTNLALEEELPVLSAKAHRPRSTGRAPSARISQFRPGTANNSRLAR